MASLNYLLANRAKFKFGSTAFFRAWAKRVLTFPELMKRNKTRSTLVRKGAAINETAEIGEAKVGGDKSRLTIGKFSFLGKVEIALHDEVAIGDYVCINDNVEILTASHDVADPLWMHVKAKIVIEDYAWIGTGAMILPGVKIGRGAVVGARAVVTRSVEAGTIVAGNPARPIPKKRCTEFAYNPCEFLAANRAWLVG